MASLFITRQNVPSFKEWKTSSGASAPAACKGVGAIQGVWLADALNNLPAVRAFIKVPSANREGFLTGGGVGQPGGPLVQFEEHTIDLEVGLGGQNKLKGAAIMMCRVTLACPFDDFKVIFVETIVNFYPGLVKAYLCKMKSDEKTSDERALCVVYFDSNSLADVKIAHNLTKPTPFRSLIDESIVKEVDVVDETPFNDVIGYTSSNNNAMPPTKLSRFDWMPEVSVAFDDSNKGGQQNMVEMWGRINGEHIAKLEAACEYLAKHQHTFSYTVNHSIEADLELTVIEKCTPLPGKAKDHLRMHAGGPLVLLNGVYLGSIREFESWANKTYGYVDKTMDALYSKRARTNLANYMAKSEDTKDFVYYDMAYTTADGTEVALKPRIVVELYKKLLPKAAFNMVTMCEDKLAGTAVHRVVSKGWVQMGAGLGDVSIYGGTFEDESFSVKHKGAGDVGMASTGPHSNACQFYFSLDKLEWLDGQKVVVGRVVDGLKAVKAIGRSEVQPWNQRPKMRHYVASCGKLTPEMVLDKRTALHAGATPGAASADVMTISDDAPDAAAGGSADVAAGEKAVAGEEAAGEEAGPEIFDINSYDDDARKAALKMQQCGRGMLARKHAKLYIEMKFTETVADVAADKLWEVLGDFEAAGLLAAGWYDSIRDKGENKLGSQRTVVPGKGWWCETPREESLVTRNTTKMWLSYVILGPKENLEKAKYTDCTITWKIRGGDSGGSVVSCVVKCIPKPEFTAEQISPSFNTEFTGILAASLTVAKGDVSENSAAAAPPLD